GQATVSFGVPQRHYAPSVLPLEQALLRVPGVIRAAANQATETVTVDYVPGVTTAEALERAVEQAGFEVAEPIPTEDPVERERIARQREIRTLRGKFALAAVVGVVTLLGSMLLTAEVPDSLLGQVDVLGRLLMPLGMKLRDAFGGEGAVDPEWVKRGLALLTLPVVVWWGRQFYRGAWSGFRHRTADMNTLIAVGTGAAYVYSLVATFNTTGSITFRATRVGRDTALGQIVQLVEEAQATKAPIQRLADRVAGVFVPVVIALAIAAFVIWFDLGPPPAVIFSTVALITVLIIACPCALGLATPTAILVGTGKAAEHGILIRSGAALEALTKVRIVLLDKTGTITEGKPTVTHIVAAKRPDGTPIAPADVLKWAASVEQRSEHPLAAAVLKAARE